MSQILKINYSKDLLAEEVNNYIMCSSTLTIDIDYTLGVKSFDGIREEYKTKSFKTIEWKPNHSSDLGKDLDLIVFRDSYDLWPLSLERQLHQKYEALVDRGFILCLFKYRLTEPEVVLRQINGWKADYNIELENRINSYLKAASSLGFRLIGRMSDSIGWTSVLLRKFSAEPIALTNESVLYITKDTSEWFERLKQKMSDNIDNDSKTKIWLISEGPATNGIIGLTKCLRYEPGGENVRCLFVCDQNIQGHIDFTKTPFSNILNNDLAINVIKEGRVGTYRNLTLPKTWTKTQSDRYFLSTGSRKEMSDLQWFDLTHFTPLKRSLDQFSTKINKLVDCEVYLSGLNCNDVDQLTGWSFANIHHAYFNFKFKVKYFKLIHFTRTVFWALNLWAFALIPGKGLWDSLIIAGLHQMFMRTVV